MLSHSLPVTQLQLCSQSKRWPSVRCARVPRCRSLLGRTWSLALSMQEGKRLSGHEDLQREGREGRAGRGGSRGRGREVREERRGGRGHHNSTQTPQRVQRVQQTVLHLTWLTTSMQSTFHHHAKKVTGSPSLLYSKQHMCRLLCVLTCSK